MNQKLNRKQAILILKKMLSNKSLYIHSMSVGLIMEAYAKKNRLGIWKGNFDMPEKWRKKNKKN